LAANILGLFSLKLVSACCRVEGGSRIVVKASSIQAGVQCPRGTMGTSTSSHMMAGVSSLNFRSSPNLRIKWHPRIMSGDVGESEPDSERNTGCSNFLFGAN
jgi:hypothetical protein